MAGFVRFIARLLRGYCARICFVAAIGGESGQVRHGGKAPFGLRFAWDTQKSVGVLMDRTPTHYKTMDLRLRRLDLLGNNANCHGQQHIGQGVAYRGVNAHQQAVGDEAHQPDDQIARVGGHGKAVAL